MRLLIFLAVIGLTGCGTNSTSPAPVNSIAAGTTTACGSSQSLGVWTESGSSDSLYLRADCTGYSSRCNSNFTYAPSGLVTVQSSNGAAGCPHAGANTCTFDDSVPHQLTVNCTGTPMVFHR